MLSTPAMGTLGASLKNNDIYKNKQKDKINDGRKAEER
jgi:hypothetical protein